MLSSRSEMVKASIGNCPGSEMVTHFIGKKNKT